MVSEKMTQSGRFEACVWRFSISKCTRIVAVILAATSVLVFVAFCISVRTFAIEQAIEPRSAEQRGGVVRVALIGDSWINGEDLDSHVIEFLSSYGWKVELDSFGQGGARTRKIYENLFLKAEESYSSRPVLFSDDPYDFVVIISGVNDSAGYMGSDFYSHHLILIAKTVLKRGSLPVIVELPEYGIEHVESNNPVGYVRRRLFRWMYDNGKIDVITNYRKAFSNNLREAFDSSEYIFVNFDGVTKDYADSVEIYANPSHLNDAGNRLLSGAIAVQLDKWLTENWE